MNAFMDELRWRGLLQDRTEGAEEHLAGGPRAIYIGFDPTAASLHVGSLLVIMTLVHAQRHGHTPIALVGGGTGLIGDPSWKASARKLLSEDIVRANGEAIGRQLARFLDFGKDVRNAALLPNNLEWLGGLSLVSFLRDVGKHFSVNQMIARDTVRRRLEDSEAGISFTEFSYSLLQAYDFVELYRRHDCTVQMGGSDQWGNITAGTELVRRMVGGRVFGVVSPLVTNASGAKFGKTEAGTVWLDPELTSPYHFYQYWLNTADADVIRHLKAFTLLDRDETTGLAEAVRDEPHRREAQTRLAADITRRGHGEDGLRGAKRATRALFGGDLDELSGDELSQVFAYAPTESIPKEELEGKGMEIARFAYASGVAVSMSDARRGLAEGSIYLNNERVTSPDMRVTAADILGENFIVPRRGKKGYRLVKVVGGR